MDSVASDKKRNIDGQISLFGLTEDEDFKAPEITYPNIKEFAKNNLLAMEKEMTGAVSTGERVVVSDNIITGRGPGVAVDFALTLIEHLTDRQKAEEIKNGLQG